MSIIMANHLKKSFGVDVVLEDVSFHIDPGDKIALLGVNGAGEDNPIPPFDRGTFCG